MPSDDSEKRIWVTYEGAYGYGPIRPKAEEAPPPGSPHALNRIEIPAELLARYDAAKAEWDAVQKELMVFVGVLERTKEYREASVWQWTRDTLSWTNSDPEIMNEVGVREFVSRVAGLPLGERHYCCTKLNLFQAEANQANRTPSLSELLAKLLEIAPLQGEKGE